MGLRKKPSASLWMAQETGVRGHQTLSGAGFGTTTRPRPARKHPNGIPDRGFVEPRRGRRQSLVAARGRKSPVAPQGGRAASPRRGSGDRSAGQRLRGRCCHAQMLRRATAGFCPMAQPPRPSLRGGSLRRSAAYTWGGHGGAEWLNSSGCRWELPRGGRRGGMSGDRCGARLRPGIGRQCCRAARPGGGRHRVSARRRL